MTEWYTNKYPNAVNYKIENKKTDIFEDMKELVGCDNISDLPYRKRAVWEEIKRQSPLTYPKEQLEKFSHYVFGVDYAVVMGILEMKKGSDMPCTKCESTF